VRLADAPLHAGTLNQTIPLKTHQMSAHRILRQGKRFCQVAYGPILDPEQRQNLTPRAFEQTLTPGRRFHA
jgi:hypothetical protein